MAFVNNDKGRRWNVAPGKRLRTGNLNRRVGVGPVMRTLNDANILNPLTLERMKGLLDQRYSRNDEDYGVAALKGTADDFSGNVSFAGAGRQLENRATMAGPQRLADKINSSLLIGTESAISHRLAPI